MGDRALAVGGIVGYGSIKSASRMNQMVVVFVGSTDKVDQLVVAEVAIKGEHTPLFPLSNLAKRDIFSLHSLRMNYCCGSLADSVFPDEANSSWVQAPAAEPCGAI